MHSDRTKDALHGIRLNIEAIRDFIRDTTSDTFSSDLRTLYAVTRALEIISEASRRLPDDLKARYPTVPWSAVQASGNVYRHSYSQVSAAFIWDTATSQLATLWEVVIKEMPAVDEDANVNAARECGSDESLQT